MDTCADCRFWTRNRERARDRGECTLFSDDATDNGTRPPLKNPPQPLALLIPFQGADGATFETAENFGCVQWQHREERESSGG